VATAHFIPGLLCRLAKKHSTIVAVERPSPRPRSCRLVRRRSNRISGPARERTGVVLASSEGAEMLAVKGAAGPAHGVGEAVALVPGSGLRQALVCIFLVRGAVGYKGKCEWLWLPRLHGMGLVATFC